METTKISVQATISADLNKVWKYWNLPEHIVNWNLRNPSKNKVLMVLFLLTVI